MNFAQHFTEGLQGRNVGLSTGIPPLDKATGGIQRKSIIGIAASPKVGKTTLTDYSFVIAPYEQALSEKRVVDISKIDWIYLSYEIDRISKEYDYISHYMYRMFQITNFEHKGKIYEMSSDYLMGKVIDDDELPIIVKDEHIPLVKQIYAQKIIPLFGEYDIEGRKISNGKIEFITDKENPTGIRNYLLKVAKQRGEFLFEKYETIDDSGKKIKKERIIGYKLKKEFENTYLIVITDHMRKPKMERGYTLKQNVDKLLEYQVELRDWCYMTFVDIIHLNRTVGSIERIKHGGEYLYPTGDDLKDTGNMSEDCNTLITMFNPTDEKYGLIKHFGVELSQYPNYRSIHVVESRNTKCPAHIQVRMFGGIKTFSKL